LWRLGRIEISLLSRGDTLSSSRLNYNDGTDKGCIGICCSINTTA